MTAVGLIFSNIHDTSIPELTRRRTIGSVPFGGRYRLIDFTVSSMVNSGITKIGVVTHNNYQSLIDHLGNGKDWDLARRSGGLKILPPFISSHDNAAANKFYTSRLEALMGTVSFLSRCREDYIVMSDCDVICKIDLNDVIEKHAETSADITFVTKVGELTGVGMDETLVQLKADESGRVTDVTLDKLDGVSELYINIMVMKRQYLLDVIENAIAHGHHSFLHDIIMHNVDKAKYMVYRYDGFYAHIGSMASYFACSMKLLEADARERLFGIKNRPVLTKVRNSAPTRYCNGAKVTNSVIAEGCVIEGTVENSILFRGVRVGKGTVVRNSILMQDTYVGDDASLNCVISDKNVMIKDKRRLSGHETMPFYIGKNMSV